MNCTGSATPTHPTNLAGKPGRENRAAVAPALAVRYVYIRSSSLTLEDHDHDADPSPSIPGSIPQCRLGYRRGLDHPAKRRFGAGAPAADKVLLGLIGAGGRGSNLAMDFASRGDVQFVGIADPDANRHTALSKALAERQSGSAPQGVADYRKVLDDKSVDAVIVATPDHWHALATIRGCQAGKDVYVEKPPSHNSWEGRKMVEAARKYKRIVQVGTQNRSAEYNMAARKYIADGKLGKVHFCRIYNQKGWANFPLQPDSEPPAGFDWDRWNGPAPEAQVQLDVPPQLAPLLALLQRRHHQRRHPPDRPGPLCAGRGLSQAGLLDRRRLRARRRRIAGHASRRLRLRRHDGDLRADAVHAVHAEDLAHHPPVAGQVPLLAAVRRRGSRSTAAKG